MHWFGWRGGDDRLRKLQLYVFKIEALVDYGES